MYTHGIGTSCSPTVSIGLVVLAYVLHGILLIPWLALTPSVDTYELSYYLW